MGKTYRAILKGDRLQWQGDAPRVADEVPVDVIVPDPEKSDQEEQERRQRLRKALEELAALNPFRDIKDPVEWQREIRRDRPLPGRE